MKRNLMKKVSGIWTRYGVKGSEMGLGQVRGIR